MKVFTKIFLSLIYATLIAGLIFICLLILLSIFLAGGNILGVKHVDHSAFVNFMAILLFVLPILSGAIFLIYRIYFIIRQTHTPPIKEIKISDIDYTSITRFTSKKFCFNTPRDITGTYLDYDYISRQCKNHNTEICVNCTKRKSYQENNKYYYSSGDKCEPRDKW